MKKRNSILTTLSLTSLLLVGCTTTTAQISRIDLETAKAAAVESAGFTLDEVSFHSVELDSRNGIEYYDVDFSVDGKEFDYDIDALTGTVIGTESPKEEVKAIATEPLKVAEAPSTTETEKKEEPAKAEQPATVNSAKELSKTDAKKIALAQVPGAKEADIREFEVDYDDGRLEYEGSIYFGEMEYEFEIDGYSGAIRSWEVESIYD